MQRASFYSCGSCHTQNDGRYLRSLNEGIKMVGLAKTVRFERFTGPTVGLSGLDSIH